MQESYECCCYPFSGIPIQKRENTNKSKTLSEENKKKNQ
jgi:hypothetical protein